jgi:H2-forming N5,N10-methylenetetrahydromethanopterin dehydrogenase-like enzyme
MIIRIKIFFIKLFTSNKIEVDRKIIKLLSKEAFLTRKYCVGDLLKKLDKYKLIKPKSEFIFLAKIMQKELNLSNQRILNSFNEMDDESKKIMYEYAPEEFKEKFRRSE